MSWLRPALRSQAWPVWLIVLLALAMRLWCLDIKPPHFDEGINGWFVDQMRAQGFYKYDPENYHGPLHFYVLFVSLTLFGRNLWALRIPVVLVGTASVWLVTRFAPFIGRRAALWAALALAVSPGFVFYNRYSIHETWMEFFLILFVYGVAGWRRPGTKSHLWCTVLSVAGMILTKETYIIHFAAFALALPCVTQSCRWFRCEEEPSLGYSDADRWHWGNFWKACAVGLAGIIILYSGTFLNWHGVAGLWETFAFWTKTGQEGHGHEKPFYYWLELLLFFEWPLLLGLLGCIASAFLPVPKLIRYLAIYGCGTLLGYSIVHYKTPWCIISIAWPFAFGFGALVALGYRFLRPWIVLLITGPLLLASLACSIWLNYFEYTNPKLPYVYVQTFKDIRLITDPLLELARRDPENYHMRGSVVCSSYYPLPWILGDFSQVGYYSTGIPEAPDSDFILVDESREEQLEQKLKEDYFTTNLRLREAQEPSKLYLRYERFKSLFPGRTPEFQGTK